MIITSLFAPSGLSVANIVPLQRTFGVGGPFMVVSSISSTPASSAASSAASPEFSSTSLQLTESISVDTRLAGLLFLTLIGGNYKTVSTQAYTWTGLVFHTNFHFTNFAANWIHSKSSFYLAKNYKNTIYQKL